MSNRPDYADFNAPQKFIAIESIIAKRLIEHPHAICSYSGGSDSDILIDLVERTRQMFPKVGSVKYIFFNTGLEMKAIKDHVKETSEKYGVEIEEIRPKVNIVLAVRKHGIPFMSKAVSQLLDDWQRKGVPTSVAQEYAEADDKPAKYEELKERYPHSVAPLGFLCSCNAKGYPCGGQFSICNNPYMLDFITETPPPFKVSKKCCDCCKKQPAHQAQKNYEMIITGEREAEGGLRTISFANENETGCFRQAGSGQYRLRPLFYVSDRDKAWYKEHYGIRYSDAYEVYGLKRTGCCGCPINYRATADLELIRPYEPYLVKAAWNVFGPSYLYRRQYEEYKAMRREKDRLNGQMTLEDL